MKLDCGSFINFTFQGLTRKPESPLTEASARNALLGVCEKAKTFFRSWAACLRRVFEINPVLCETCGVEMAPVAAITDDCELERLLMHLGLPTEWPKTRPARSPPAAVGIDTQINPEAERWDGIDVPLPEC